MILLSSAMVYAQSKRNDGDFMYKSETTYGINFNTNAGLIGGINIKHSRAITPTMYHYFGLEVVNMRHPKEQRTTSRRSGQTFIPGKQSYLALIRPSYGREFVLFKKEAEQGVQINALLAAGPTIGLVIPYYIDYQYDNRTQRTEKYDPTKHTLFENVIGAPSVFTGIGESTVAIGGTVRAGLQFEFGSFKTNVTGFELGITADFMSKQIIIMPLAENKSNYISAYVVLFYGARK
ncbi:MAG: hypothetical protein EAZ08_07285 [Cytophagales bacterium]|nr:MAG: hypothetical protein EAZ08_07285 [Cytophagales bacterium]